MTDANDETATVTVEIPQSEPEPVAETPAVVVVESGDDGATDHIIDHAERLSALESENAELRSQIASASADAATATEIAMEIATAEPEPEPVAVIEPTPEPEPEPDIEPSREHAWFRNVL